MIARTLRGLGALAVVVLGLLGWPVLLLAIGNGVADWLPDLADPLALLSRPDTGGLFLVIVLALAWAAWLVWSVALAVEVAAQVRGVPTPRLGGLFPQGAAAALVTAIAVAFLNSPGMALAAPAPQATGTAMNSLSASAATAAHGLTATSTDQPEATDEFHNYTVRHGDTLWDIADEQLDDPLRWPDIADASDEINQPDGRQLEDPDLIVPGWTLQIPTPPRGEAPTEAAPEPPDEPSSEQRTQVTPPATPMRPASSTGEASEPGDAVAASPKTPMDHATGLSGGRGGGAPRGASSAIPSAGSHLPSTPLRVEAPETVAGPPTSMTGGIADAQRDHSVEDASVVGLPDWITSPLVPTNPRHAEDLVTAAHAGVAARGAQ